MVIQLNEKIQESYFWLKHWQTLKSLKNKTKQKNQKQDGAQEGTALTNYWWEYELAHPFEQKFGIIMQIECVYIS